MKLMVRASLLVVCLGMAASSAMGSFLTGTSPVFPGTTTIPGIVVATGPGTLLASLSAPYSFSTTAGTTSGTLLTAVYRNNTGTLDFWYQVANSGSSATAIARETDVNFAGFLTAVGYSLTSFGPFTSGSVAPLTGDSSSLGPGSTIGFTFGPPDSNKIAPGQTSFVFVISTSATLYTSGNASIIDGGTQTVAAFQPATASQVNAPEPSTLVLLSSAVLGFVGRRRRKLS